MGWELIYTVFPWEHHTTVNPGVPYAPDHEIYPYETGHHLIEFICESPQTWMTVEPALAHLGATNISHDGYVINAWLPMGTTSQATRIAGIESMRPAFRQTQSGTTTSQGDRALAADAARALPAGLTGAGITIGTLSDSFATAPAPLTTATEDLSNGDLPDGIEVLRELGNSGSDEGRAMMQIIHDLAPGAEQKFFTAFNGQAGFANGIRALSAAGCDIIVDDVFFFAEPMFQKCLIAQAVNEVSADGKAYFSVAENSARQSWAGSFQFATGAQGLSGGPLHDFDPGPGVDPHLEFTLPVGETVTFNLQWDQPFFSISGAPGCETDLDFFVTPNGDELGTVLTLAGTSRNLGGDPLEILGITNPGTIDIDGVPGADTEFNLTIEGLAGFAPGLMKIVMIHSDAFTLNEFDTQSGTLVGHANAEQAIAVAAAPFFRTPTFGANPPQLEPFSSSGGNPLLFADDGTRLEAPLDTQQPRFTAADGGHTTFFGQQIGDGDDFPNFYGTSAAAPHAAAVAALMMEKSGGPGSLSPKEVITVLSKTAIETGPRGFDVESGSGLINALDAVNLIEASFQTADDTVAFEGIELFEEGGELTSVNVTFSGLVSGTAYLLRRSTGSGIFSNIVVDEAVVDGTTFTFVDESPSDKNALYQLGEGQLPLNKKKFRA